MMMYLSRFVPKELKIILVRVRFLKKRECEREKERDDSRERIVLIITMNKIKIN